MSFPLNCTFFFKPCSGLTCCNESSVQRRGAQAGASVMHGWQRVLFNLLRLGLEAETLHQAGRGSRRGLWAVATVYEDHTQHSVQHSQTQIVVVYEPSRKAILNTALKLHRNNFCSVDPHLLAVFSEAMYFHSLLALGFWTFAAWLEGERLPEELQLSCLWALSRTGFFCKSTMQRTEAELAPQALWWPIIAYYILHLYLEGLASLIFTCQVLNSNITLRYPDFFSTLPKNKYPALCKLNWSWFIAHTMTICWH